MNMHFFLFCLLFIFHIIAGDSTVRTHHNRSLNHKSAAKKDTSHNATTANKAGSNLSEQGKEDTSKTKKSEATASGKPDKGKDNNDSRKKDLKILELQTAIKHANFKITAYQSLLIAYVFLSILLLIILYSKYTRLMSSRVPVSMQAPAIPVFKTSPPKQSMPEPPPAYNTNSLNINHQTVKGHWLITGASVIGQSHTTNNKPCQDNYLIDILNDKWGIAIVCDGAGSAANSDLGSKYVSQQMANYLKKTIFFNKWMEKDYLPSQKEWDEIAFKGYGYILSKVKNFAQDKSLPPKSLACTVIAVIYSPLGLLVTHVGDGRAAFCDQQGNWKPLIKPHKGQEANETIFLTSDAWTDPGTISMNGVNVPESRIVKEKVLAFSLMSDGCEAHSFLSSQIDPNTNMWSDPNQPFINFFNPVVSKLKEMQEKGMDQKAISSTWEKFLTDGTPSLQKESDDKTMIIGILN